jgi:hypothetical protein
LEDVHCLNIKIPKKVMGDFNAEVVNKFGMTYGNTVECIVEAMKLWVKESKENRIQKERESKELKREKINADI